MGTAVLSPQDCLVSAHGRHDHRFKDPMHPSSPKAPRSGRKSLQAAAMQSVIPSMVPDRASWKSSGAACKVSDIDVLNRFNDSPGLLPVPIVRLDSRHSSLTSFSSAVSSAISSRSRKPTASTVITSPWSRSASSSAPISSTNLKSSFSRSVPRGSRATAVGEFVQESLILSNDRVPSETVQNNRTRNRAAYELETAAIPVRCLDSQSSKFSDLKRRSHEKRIVGDEHLGDLRKRTHADFVCQQGVLEMEGLALSRTGSLEGGGGMNGIRRDAEGKKIGKRRETDRGISGKEVDVGKTPVVTILQRPKDKDAAVELIARFFNKLESSPVKKGTGLQSRVEESFSDHPIHSKMNGCCVANDDTEMKILLKSPEGPNGTPEIENVPMVPESSAASEDHHLTIQDRDSYNGLGLLRQRSMDSQITSSHHHTGVMDASPCKIKGEEDVGFGEISKYIASIFGDDKWLPLFCNERWAGPAFTNSPPPSSLPLPNFPMKQFRTSPTQSSCIGNPSVAGSSYHSSTGAQLVSILPSRRSVSFNGRSLVKDQEGACDIAFATKDLRRMLNLDAC